jgi:hypothetical protein
VAGALLQVEMLLGRAEEEASLLKVMAGIHGPGRPVAEGAQPPAEAPTPAA